MWVSVREIAHARSGDKGDIVNIAVFAYEEEFYPYLKQQLTAERVKEFYAELIQGSVTRFEVDGIWALNFVGLDALGGGVSRNLRLDNYGKALSAAILGYEIQVPDELWHRREHPRASSGEEGQV